MDVNGRVWERTERDFVALGDDYGAYQPKPFEDWFQARSWQDGFHSRPFERAHRKAVKRPRRVPWEVRLMEVTGGYGAGKDDAASFPRNAPKTWHYRDLLHPDDPKPRASTA